MLILRKGDRIQASWFEANLDASLAGMQLKVGASRRDVSGVVRHIRASRPDAIEPEAIFIDPDPGWDGPMERPPGCTCLGNHVLVKPAWIITTTKGVEEDMAAGLHRNDKASISALIYGALLGAPPEHRHKSWIKFCNKKKHE